MPNYSRQLAVLSYSVTDHDGFIYVIQDTEDICKIGRTSSEPKERCLQLATMFHRSFKLRGYFPSENSKTEEKELHEYFKEFSVRGEWFSLSYDEIKRRSEEKNIYFQDLEVWEFINKAPWHWCPKRNDYVRVH